MKSKWMKCRTDHIPRSAALGDLLRGHLVQSVHAPCTYTRFNIVCCWEGPHWEPTPYILFFFFFFKKYELSVEFGSEKYAKTWEFGLRKFNKSRNGQFWLRNLVLPISATGCYTDGWGWRGKVAAGGYWVQSFKWAPLCAAYTGTVKWWMRWSDDLFRDGLTMVFCRMHGWDDVE